MDRLQSLMSQAVAAGHYICLTSPGGGKETFGAAIYSNGVRASRSCITTFYHHRNPKIAIQQAIQDHRAQMTKQGRSMSA